MQDQASRAPRVSVIIPVYNVAGYIGEALQSVFAQTFTDFEVIVINDGSPDTPQLEAALGPYRERIVYLKKSNGGISSARNHGIRAARGALLTFLDGDDAWEPTYLEVLTGVLDSDPTVDAVFPIVLYTGEGVLVGRTLQDFYPVHGEVTFEAMWQGTVNVPAVILVRREAVMAAGLFDEELRYCEDFSIALNLLKAGRRIVHQRDVLYRYRQHSTSLSTNLAAMLEAKIQVADKCLRTLTLTPAEEMALRRARIGTVANLNRERGRAAFFAGDTREAIARLREANQTLNSKKLFIVIALLQVAPGLLHSVYGLWERCLAVSGRVRLNGNGR
jgi:GT2 family glycosyltransferase